MMQFMLFKSHIFTALAICVTLILFDVIHTVFSLSPHTFSDSDHATIDYGFNIGEVHTQPMASALDVETFNPKENHIEEFSDEFNDEFTGSPEEVSIFRI